MTEELEGGWEKTPKVMLTQGTEERVFLSTEQKQSEFEPKEATSQNKGSLPCR